LSRDLLLDYNEARGKDSALPPEIIEIEPTILQVLEEVVGNYLYPIGKLSHILGQRIYTRTAASKMIWAHTP